VKRGRDAGSRLTNPAPGFRSAPPMLAPPTASLWDRHFTLSVAVQTAFGFGTSVLLLIPSFLARELGAGATAIGAAAMCQGVAALLGTLLVAVGVDRIGRRPFIFTGCALLVALSLGYVTVRSMGPLVYALQAATGAAFVLVFNANLTLATDRVAPDRMGQAIGVVGAANILTNAVAPPVAELLAHRSGWGAAFWLAAAAGMAALLIALSLQEASVNPAPDATGPSEPGSLGPVLAGSLVFGAIACTMFTFVQPYALERGAAGVSHLFLGFAATAFGVRMVLGSIGDRYGYRRVASLSFAAYAVVTLAVVWLRVDALWLYGAGFGVAHGLIFPNLSALAVGCAGPALRGRNIALQGGAYNAGVALSAVLWGWLASGFGYPSVFAVATALGAGAALLLARGLPARAEPRLNPD
jgi:predicted MFS family arabinose efflux permease